MTKFAPLNAYTDPRDFGCARFDQLALSLDCRHRAAGGQRLHLAAALGNQPQACLQ
jgi:hypothetical protein